MSRSKISLYTFPKVPDPITLDWSKPLVASCKSCSSKFIPPTCKSSSVVKYIYILYVHAHSTLTSHKYNSSAAQQQHVMDMHLSPSNCVYETTFCMNNTLVACPTTVVYTTSDQRNCKNGVQPCMVSLVCSNRESF